MKVRMPSLRKGAEAPAASTLKRAGVSLQLLITQLKLGANRVPLKRDGVSPSSELDSPADTSLVKPTEIPGAPDKGPTTGRTICTQIVRFRFVLLQQDSTCPRVHPGELCNTTNPSALQRASRILPGGGVSFFLLYFLVGKRLR
jgi:hypothetical protein